MSAPSGTGGGAKRVRTKDTASGSKGPDEARSRAKADELRLAARAARGDAEAFSKLVRAHSDRVLRVALRTLGGAAEAEDAAQEVWIRAWANIKGFRGDSAFGTWLHRVALNTCLDVRRRRARREDREAGEGALPHLPAPAGGDHDPETAALMSENRDRVRTALDGVRAEHRSALLLRHVEDLSYADVAQILEVPEGTAKGWASRGRAAMLAALPLEEHARRGTAPLISPTKKPAEKVPEPSPNP